MAVTDDNIKEETADEAAADLTEDQYESKDLRKQLTVASMATTPADGIIQNFSSGMTVTVNLTGGVAKENITANVVLLDASGAVALGADKTPISAKTAGSTTWTFTAQELVKLSAGTYTVAINSDGVTADKKFTYAPLELAKTATPKTVTVAKQRVDRPDLGAMSLSQTSWDLVTDKATDVVLTVAASDKLEYAVPATFVLKGKNAAGADEPITVEATLTKDAETKVTFKAADLAKLAASATAYNITVATPLTADYNEKAAATIAPTLTVTGATREAYTITGGAIDTTDFTSYTLAGPSPQTTVKQYKLYSGSPITIKDVTNDATTGTLPVRVAIGAAVTYDTVLAAVTGDIKIPSDVLVQAAAAGNLKTTITTTSVTDPTTNVTTTTDADAPYPVTVQILGSATLKPSAAKSVGTLSVYKTSDDSTTSVVQFTSATITNGDYNDGTKTWTNAFGRARGTTSGLRVVTRLTANHATASTAKIDLKGNLTIGTGSATGGNYYVTKVLAALPFSVSTSVTSGTNATGYVDVTVDIPASVMNSLPEYTEQNKVQLFFGMNVEGNDMVKKTTFNDLAIGSMTLYDSYLPTPIYDGTQKDRTWTKGGAKITLGNVSFKDGVEGRTMNAKVYALTGKLSSLVTTGAAPSGAIELGSHKVATQGKTASFVLTQKNLEKLTAGKVYYLYIVGEKDTYNKVTQFGTSSTLGITDRGYIGKLTVKAKSTSSGGSSSSGSSGSSSSGSGSDTTNSTTSSDGGTDSVSDKSTAADTTSASQIAFGTYQTLDSETLAWMLARQPLMGREFLKYLLNQKGSQKVAIPLAYVADMEDPIKIPIVGGGQYDLGLAVFTPAKEGDTTGYTFTVEPKPYADTTDLKMHLGADFEDLARTLSDADYYKPGDFVPVSTLKLAQLDGNVVYEASKAEQVKIDSAVTNRITEWMAQG